MRDLQVALVDPDSGDVIWTGSLSQFDRDNADAPMTASERAILFEVGSVELGGGAAARFRLTIVSERFAAKQLERYRAGICESCGSDHVVDTCNDREDCISCEICPDDCSVCGLELGGIDRERDPRSGLVLPRYCSARCARYDYDAWADPGVSRGA